MFEPGSARYGNFINYYFFNPSSERLKLLENEGRSVTLHVKSSDEYIYALDVGCNSGLLTKDLYETFKTSGHKIKILGLDIDPILIQRSKELNIGNRHLIFEAVDITSVEGKKAINEFFNANKINNFKISFLFSVTMWIHLNKGDEIFKEFLRYVASVSEYILLEPQSWKSYKAAVRRNKKLGSHIFNEFDKLEWRDDVIEKICNFLKSSDCNMTLVDNFGKTDWDRSIFLFEKRKI